MTTVEREPIRARLSNPFHARRGREIRQVPVLIYQTAAGRHLSSVGKNRPARGETRFPGALTRTKEGRTE